MKLYTQISAESGTCCKEGVRRDEKWNCKVTWVDERIFAGGGAYIARNWLQFRADSGVEAVLELADEAQIDFQNNRPQRYLWMPISHEDEAGSVERVQAARFIAETVYSGKIILLYAVRRHRARWAFVSFLIYRGMKVPAAIRKAEEAPWLAPYKTDLPAWEAYFHYLHHPDT